MSHKLLIHLRCRKRHVQMREAGARPSPGSAAPASLGIGGHRHQGESVQGCRSVGLRWRHREAQGRERRPGPRAPSPRMAEGLPEQAAGISLWPVQGCICLSAPPPPPSAETGLMNPEPALERNLQPAFPGGVLRS